MVGLVVLSAPAAVAQERLPRRNGVRPERKVRTIRDYSWIFIDAPEQREMKVHDIVTVIVDDKSEATVNSRFNRTKNTNLKAELKEFIRLNDDGNLTLNEFIASGKIKDKDLAETIYAALDSDGDGALVVPEYLRVWGRWARSGRRTQIGVPE